MSRVARGRRPRSSQDGSRACRLRSDSELPRFRPTQTNHIPIWCFCLTTHKLNLFPPACTFAFCFNPFTFVLIQFTTVEPNMNLISVSFVVFSLSCCSLSQALQRYATEGTLREDGRCGPFFEMNSCVRAEPIEGATELVNSFAALYPWPPS